MSESGYVYVLGNHYMPDIFKVGMTARNPQQRAAELSAGTAVPFPFELMYWAQVDDARMVERVMHREFIDNRVSPSREFFDVDFVLIVDVLSRYANKEWSSSRKNEINSYRAMMSSAFPGLYQPMGAH